MHDPEQERWDAEIDQDATAGKLDFLIAEAREDREENRLECYRPYRAAVGELMKLASVFLLALAAQAQPKFEVISVKRCTAADLAALVQSQGGGRNGGSPAGNPGRLSLACRMLPGLITDAYLKYAGGETRALVSGGEELLRGLPGWAETERYTIDAEPETPRTREMMLGPMMQALLADRFQLKLHREGKEVPALALVAAKDGLKLKPANDCPAADGRPCGYAGDFDDGFHAYGWTIADLCNNLGHRVGRDVIDRTGAPGKFEWFLDLPPTGPPGANESVPLNVVNTALRKNGLTLEAAKANAEFLVIDRIERPSEN